MSVVDDLDQNGVYDDAPDIVAEFNHDGRIDAKDLEILGVASNIEQVRSHINANPIMFCWVSCRSSLLGRSKRSTVSLLCRIDDIAAYEVRRRLAMLANRPPQSLSRCDCLY
ncbi:hypothetical protein [Saccharopolyspora sp. NPDC002376]